MTRTDRIVNSEKKKRKTVLFVNKHSARRKSVNIKNENNSGSSCAKKKNKRIVTSNCKCDSSRNHLHCLHNRSSETKSAQAAWACTGIRISNPLRRTTPFPSCSRNRSQARLRVDLVPEAQMATAVVISPIERSNN